MVFITLLAVFTLERTAKHFKEPLTISVALEEERKIKAIKELKIKGVGFACSSGFDFENPDNWVMLSGRDLYSL